MRAVEGSRRRPLGLAADVVEVVADDVDVRIARVVRLCAVAGDVGAAVPLRVPDDGRVPVRGECAAKRRHPEPAQRCGDTRPAVDGEVDARERLAEHRGRVVGPARTAAVVVRAVRVPVTVHLRERPHVDLTAETRDRLVEGEQERVARAARDLRRRDRGRADAEHRPRAHHSEQLVEVADAPAGDQQPRVRELAGERMEARGIAEHTEIDLPLRGRRGETGTHRRGRDRRCLRRGLLVLSGARSGAAAEQQRDREGDDPGPAHGPRIVEPIIAGLNIGGGVAGVGFPMGAAARLAYNSLVMPRLISDVPSVKEMRELFQLLAAKAKHPQLRLKPAATLPRSSRRRCHWRGSAPAPPRCRGGAGDPACR